MPVGDLANLSKYSKITLLLATIVSLGKSIIDPTHS